MKIAKAAAALVGAASLIGVSLPANAIVIHEETANAIEAEVVPTAQESRKELLEVGQQLHQAEFASVSTPQAERDYVAAWRAYDIGSFDAAVNQAQAVASEISAAPNWRDRNTTR